MKMPPKKPPRKKPTAVDMISPTSFEEKSAIPKIEKAWIAFFSGSIIITQDMPITMGLTLSLIILTSFGEILWQKIHPNKEAPLKK